MSIELVPFTNLSALLGLSKTESNYPDLTLLQESVVASFESFTRRWFTPDSYTETVYSGNTKTQMIPLMALPIKSVSAVIIDGVPTTAFKIRYYGIELATFTANSEVIVTYAGGLETVSGALQRAALLQTVFEYQNKDSIGIQTVSTEGGTVTKPELSMLKEVRSLLVPFIHPFPAF